MALGQDNSGLSGIGSDIAGNLFLGPSEVLMEASHLVDRLRDHCGGDDGCDGKDEKELYQKK